MLFDRQKHLLVLLDALGGSVGNLDFQKLLLLFCRELGDDAPYDFVPYRFGAFSFTSNADRRKLVEAGHLVDDDRVWTLTPGGRVSVAREARKRERAETFASTKRLRGDPLVALTYRRFPWFATRSESAARILRDDPRALAAIDAARPVRPPGGALLTIGYEGRSLEAYLDQLLRASATLLCDVRRNPVSRRFGFSKSTLSRRCEDLGIRYEHVPELGIVTVKTYPTLSQKYGETVCTAGVRPDGTWVRIYPVPFRRLDEAEQYRKYDWIEARLQRNPSDPRPETHRPVDESELAAVDHIPTDRGWADRRAVVLGKCRVWDRLGPLIEAAKGPERTSLAVFRPTRIVDFESEAEEERTWDPAKLDAMRAASSQFALFDDNAWRTTFQVIPKLPYRFRYTFEDADGQRARLSVFDWEAGALYWKCLRSAEGDERVAVAKVREKYLDEFLPKDLHFFLGTTAVNHFRAPNPFIIIGVFYPPKVSQLGLF